METPLNSRRRIGFGESIVSSHVLMFMVLLVILDKDDSIAHILFQEGLDVLRP